MYPDRPKNLIAVPEKIFMTTQP